MRQLATLLLIVLAGCGTQRQPPAQLHKLSVWEAAALARQHPNKSLNRLVRDATRYMVVATHNKTLQGIVDEFDAAGIDCASKGTTSSDSELIGKSQYFNYQFVLRKNAIDNEDLHFDLTCELSAEDNPSNPLDSCLTELRLTKPIPSDRVLTGQLAATNSVLDQLFATPEVVAECNNNAEIYNIVIQYQRFREARYAGFEPSGFDIFICFREPTTRTSSSLSFHVISGLDPKTDTNGSADPDEEYIKSNSTGEFIKVGSGNGQWTPAGA